MAWTPPSDAVEARKQTATTGGWKPPGDALEARPVKAKNLGLPAGEDLAALITPAEDQPQAERKVYTGSVFDTEPFDPKFNPEEAARLSRREYAEKKVEQPRRTQSMRATPADQIDRTLGQAIADTGIGLLQGAAGIPKGIAANINAGDNPVAKFYEEAIQAGERSKSPYLQSQKAEREALLKNVLSNQGELAQTRAAFTSMFSPAGADIVAQGAGSMLPVTGMSLLGLGQKAFVATNALANAGEAAQNTARELAQMSPQDWSKSDAYQELRASGLSHADSVRMLAPIMAMPAQLVGGVVGGVSGATGLEKSLAGSAIKGGAKERLARAGSELLGEEAETLAPSLAGNITQRLIDEQTSLTEGLGREAVETAFGATPGMALAAAGRSGANAPKELDTRGLADRMARERGFLVPEERAEPPAATERRAPAARAVPAQERVEPTFDEEAFTPEPAASRVGEDLTQQRAQEQADLLELEGEAQAPERFANMDEAAKYDTPEMRLKQAEALDGDDVTGLIFGETESYGRAALKKKSLTAGYAEKMDNRNDASDAATVAFGTGDYSVFTPYEKLFPKTAVKLKAALMPKQEVAEAEESYAQPDAEALTDVGKPMSAAEEMEGVAAPLASDVEEEIGKLTEDQKYAIAERENLEKRTAGTSLMQVLKGTLNDGELSELGGRARKVGKNQFLNLKVPRGQTGASMEDMVDSGKLDIFLPEKLRPGYPDYVNSESAEYIRDKLRNNQFYTYETELAIQRINQDVESIERRIEELLSDDDINKELQYAAREQREIDQDAQEPAAPVADGAAKQRETKASNEELDKREAQLDREAELNQREARLLEERKRLEDERLKLESPTKEDVAQQEERKAKAAELDEREQVRKESEAGAGQFELTREEGRQDTTGGLFEQPVEAPKAEPKAPQVDAKEERKKALAQFKKSLLTAIPPFRSRGGDNRVTVLKPTPLSAPLMMEVVKLANDAVDLGLPLATLGNIKSAGSTRTKAIAMVSNNGWLMLGSQWKTTSPTEKLLAVIHEIGHVVDAEGGTISEKPKWDAAHNELKEWYRRSADKIRHPLAYPFASQYKGKVRIKAESFAQSFGYYFTSPVDLQKNAPEAYSQIQSIVEGIQDESQRARAAGAATTGTAGVKVQPARATEGAEVQPTSGKQRADVRATSRLEDRGAGEVKKPSPVIFYEDIPNESWLQGKVDYAIRSPRNEFGVPKMSSVTGSFKNPVMVPTRWLSDAKGQRGEEKNVRQKDLDAIRKIIRETGKFPLNEDGTEYVPYIEIGYDGKPWVSEGNHRIMAAIAEGMEYIPVELRYFDGGQRRAGKWGPDNVKEITERVSTTDQDAQDINAMQAAPDTPAFKRWSYGLPIYNSLDDNPSDRGVYRVYHATLADFKEFIPGGLSQKDSGPATWLSPYADYQAAVFRVGSEKSGFREGARVMPLYARVASPLVIDDKEMLKWSRSVYGDSEFPQLISQKTVDLLKEDGYDSILFKGEKLGWGKYSDEIIVLSPNQIKSAIGNIGTFDPDVLDINASVAPETPAFKRWFGDSKVVDENGEPKVVYHKTRADIQAFDKDKIGASDYGYAGRGFYFMPFPLQGDTYGNITMPVFLSLQNPFVIDDSSWKSEESPYRWVPANAGRLGGNKEASKAWTEMMKSKGFDGFMDKTGKGDGEIVAFEPNQIKSAIGNRGTYDPDVQDINAAISGKNVLGRKPLANWTMPDSTNMDSFIYYIQNKQVDMKDAVAAIKDQIGQIDERFDPYMKETLFAGRTATQTKRFLQNELEPLFKEMGRLDVNIPDFEEYLHNRHAQERNEQIATVNPGMPDKGSGIETADAQSYFANLPADQEAKYKKLASMVDAITSGTRQLLVDSGLESQDTIDTWESTYDNYIPLNRDDVDYSSNHGMGVGQGYSVRGPASRRAVGSERKVVDILANIAMQRERNIVRAEKNRVAMALYGMAIQNPNPEFFLAVNPDAKKDIPAATQELVDMGFLPSDIESLMNEPSTMEIDPQTGLAIERIHQMQRGADNVMGLRVNGENRYVFFNQNNDRAKRMATAIKNLDADQLGFILSTTAEITRFMAAMNTQYNPIFGAYNFLRDISTAGLQLTNTPLAGKQKEVLSPANVWGAMRGIYTDLRAERGGKAGTSNWSKLWEEFQQRGGQTGFRDQFSSTAKRGQALQRIVDPSSWADQGLGKIFTAGGALKVPAEVARKAAAPIFNWLSDYNETMENAIRLSAYKTALDNGMSKDAAAVLAKELTVNFNRKGQIATQAGALYAFFNASVQGTTALARTLSGPAGKKIVAGGLMLGAIQAVLYSMAGFDEKEPPEFVREKNFVIPDFITGSGKYIAIPLPLGYNVIPNTARLITQDVIRAVQGKKIKPVDTSFKIFESLLGAFNPIGNAGWSIQTVTPTVLDPAAALFENKDYTGKNIARKDFNALNPTPGFTRYKESSTAFSRGLAEFMNSMSGGDKDAPGRISPTPDQIDYLIGQIFGGVGREAMKIERTVRSAFTGEELPAHSIPLVGRFYGDTKGSSAVSNSFYENLKEMNIHENTVKGMRRRKENVQEYYRENPEARMFEEADRVEREVQVLRKRRRALVEKEAPKESVKAIEERITAKMKRFNDKVKQREEKKS